MSWAGGPDGNGGGPPHDGLASGRDRLGRVRARLAGGASRLRWRALRLWHGRTAPRPAPDRPPEPEARGGQGRRGSLRGRRSEEHTSELQSRRELVCRLLLEKKKKK